MDRDDAWQASIRSVLRAPESDEIPIPHDLAGTAIAAGTRRLTATMRTRALTTGAVVALGLVVCAWAWSHTETLHTSETTLREGAPWTP
jgi:hypothetical protein